MPPSLRAYYASVRPRTSRVAGRTRRPLASAATCEDATRTEVSAISNATLQIVRNWMPKLNAGGPDALIG